MRARSSSAVWLKSVVERGLDGPLRRDVRWSGTEDHQK
jgi:hypothetical protein